jgi:hypothetical protein
MLSLTKKRAGLIALALGVAVALVPAINAVAGFGPNRPTFTWANPATYITFNSITDNPYYGDERTFLTSRPTSSAVYNDTQTVNDNDEMLLRVYYHNNARSDLNLVATNTKVRFALPTTAGISQESIAYISADNANPGVVTDTTGFTSANPFTLEYVAGSARLRTNALNDVTLSDSIVTSGATIGYSSLNGQIPGCSGYSGWVTIKVRVHSEPTVTPDYSCNLLSLTTQPGRKVNASVDYSAINGATLQSVKFSWGDGSAPTITDKTTSSHSYASYGKYTVRATLTFDLGATTATSVCTKQVTFTPPNVPPVKELPNTGAGSMVGIFAGVSVLAGAAHYVFASRRGQ